MKTRNLFLSLFAFAALCACNKEAQPETPQVLEQDTFIKVNIMATDASTRAYEMGDPQENEVHNVLFLFYGASKNPVLADGYTYDWTTNTTGENVAKSATVKFNAQKEKPTSMIVILNYDSSKKSAYEGANLTTLKGMVSESFSITVDTKEYFTMTNSVYVDGSSVVCEVNLTDANFGKTKTDGQPADAVTPVDVYVERVAAKVVFNDDALSAGIQTSTENVDGEETIITPVVKGYTVINTPNKSYDFKNVLTSWDYSFTSGGDSDWSLPSDFRSFWAKIPDDVTYSELTYAAASDDEDKIYVHENTSLSAETNTKVILTAELQVDGSAVNLVRYNDTYYTLPKFKTLALNQIQALDTDITITTDMLKIVTGTAAGVDNGYEMALLLNDSYTGSKADVINTELKKMPALYWNGGKCYYYTEIKHDLFDGTSQMSGVVRNHVYNLNLKGVKGLGVPVPDPEVPIDPEEPVDEFYSLNATINILQWKVVSQDIVFGN